MKLLLPALTLLILTSCATHTPERKAEVMHDFLHGPNEEMSREEVGIVLDFFF